uniref:tRNA-dihydrouridine(47) synthase [NAD(P)(+)] n=2 Tax=Hirondellea gigas TaxID=1518452 RepID=A0A2P2I5A0_9CRUS
MRIGPASDEDLTRIRGAEKKKITWSDQLYLAPLTTLGNLPFRRICRRLGADITCGEMAVATCLLQGSPSEWALVKRHHTEKTFGVQICGSNPLAMVKCSEVLSQVADMDFVDINVGCPIDMIYKQGGGSALMRRQSALELMVRGMSKVLPCPVTVKMRTAIHQGQRTAHSLIPNCREWGTDIVTLHGRSREQRYTKSADWAYIRECAQIASPMPLFGNGDVLNYEDYVAQKQMAGVDGIMIGRGALMKPWIFTEIKENRHWDISSCERFDILKEFTNNGLEHWGSDSEGVEKTRRFLLEWLSFLHRYIPIGLLERPPQSINLKPPPYVGRNDLETLMASKGSQDWIKISEMLLGPVPDNFEFLPKHRANSWG